MNRKQFLKTGILGAIMGFFAPKAIGQTTKNNDSNFDEYYKYIDKNKFEVFRAKNGDLLIIHLKSEYPHVMYHKERRYGIHLTPDKNQLEFIKNRKNK